MWLGLGYAASGLFYAEWNAIARCEEPLIRLLCLADLHGAAFSLEEAVTAAEAPDAILLAGDLTHFGNPEEAARLVRICQAAAPTYAVAGNCDSPDIDGRLGDLGAGLHGTGVILDGWLGVLGVSAMPVWLGGTYELTEEEIAATLERGYAAFGPSPPATLLLTHTPPRGCLDLTRRGKHAGSTAVREFVERRRPGLVVCGHIHEARGCERLGSTSVVNCGPAYHGHFVRITWREASEPPEVLPGNLRHTLAAAWRP